MSYTLSQDNQMIGVSYGTIQQKNDGPFWITGWSPQLQQQVQIGKSYTIQFPNGNDYQVTVQEIGGSGMGGIKFTFVNEDE